MGSEFQEYLESCCSHRETNGYELAQCIEPHLHSTGILDLIDLMWAVTPTVPVPEPVLVAARSGQVVKTEDPIKSAERLCP